MKTLLYNGKVYLPGGIFADSVGFDSASGKILHTGSYDELKASAGQFDDEVDVDRRLVIPAFAEGHCHFIEGSYVNSQLDLRNAACKDDFVTAIREYMKLDRAWIFGGYFTDANLTDGFLPDIDFLDEICGDVPVIISRFDIHSAFANSAALKIAGISVEQQRFSPEEVVLKNGRLTGELKERARDFVIEFIPQPAFSERLDVAVKQMKKLHSLGIVAISDITLLPDLEIYSAMLERYLLKLRVDARLRFTEFHKLGEIRNDFSGYYPLIKFESLKAFYDGSLSSMTSYMHDSFKGEPGNGMVTDFVESGDFEKYALEIDRAGIQLSVHAIGDRAVTELLDLAEKLNTQNGLRDRRFRIEHAQHIRQSDFKRFADLNVIASVQPSHLYSDAATAFKILNDDSIEHNYPELFKYGARVCLGTDFPVVSESPFETIYFAMTRKANGFERGFHPEYCFNLRQCIDAYTIENAFATFQESDQGTLEPGMLADIAVIDGDMFEMNEEQIRNAEVYATYFGGECVWQKN